MTTHFMKRTYEKPSMQVYELKQQPQILVGSAGGGSLNDYNWNNIPEE